MANKVLWVDGDARTQVLGTELNSLANGAYSAVGTAIDNVAGEHRWFAFDLAVTYGSAPAAGGYCGLYLIPSHDDTNYLDGGGSVAPSFEYFVGYWALRAVTTAQLVGIGHAGRRINLGRYKFKPVLLNAAGQAMPASGSTVFFRSFDEELQ